MEKSGRCLLVSGGDFCELPEDAGAFSLVIACDRGWRYAERLGVVPDLVVGDFDSSSPPPEGMAVEVLPTRKDDTDTMWGAKRALEGGCRDIVICCAFGGRLDHSFANVQTAAWLASRGARARLLGRETDALVFSGSSLRLPRRPDRSLSVFSLTDRCTGVWIRGTKYDCEGVTLTNAFPLGVSNHWTQDWAEIGAESGILLVLQSKLREGEHI